MEFDCDKQYFSFNYLNQKQNFNSTDLNFFLVKEIVTVIYYL